MKPRALFATAAGTLALRDAVVHSRRFNTFRKGVLDGRPAVRLTARGNRALHAPLLRGSRGRGHEDEQREERELFHEHLPPEASRE